MSRTPAAIAIVAAIGLAAVGVVFGTYAAGGSDSSCYALMTDAFASGTLQPSSPLVAAVPWPDALKTFTPGGFVPSQRDPAAFAPVCAPGFSLLLAPFVKAAGPAGLFYVTPVAGGVLVWLAFLAGRALAGPLAGAMSAVLVATSPVVLFQVVQPMNDIVTATLWMAVFVALISRRIAVAGVCCGLALLVRPNLLPLAAVAGVFILVADRIPNPQYLIPSSKFVIPRVALFCLAALPFGLLVLWLNAQLYGGALRSGYGQADTLFGLSPFPANAVRYTRWIVETHTPFPFLAVVAPFVLDGRQRPVVFLALGLALTTMMVYFAYTPFDDWSYLRFLLPALSLMLVAASAAATQLAMKLGRTGTVSILAATVALAVFSIRTADHRLAFAMQALEQRYRSAGIVVRDQLPTDAVVLSVWDSGAVRFHGRKQALVWEGLDPSWLDRGLDWLAQRGRQPYILVESWEEPGFRRRFGTHSDIGKLDWPPKYEIDRVVRIYDPQDRARYHRGERVNTEFLWPLRD